MVSFLWHGKLLWEEHQWALRSLMEGHITLDADDPEVLDAVQYFIWMFDVLVPWFKQHEHKRRERCEVEKAMHERKRGTLKSGRAGKKVKTRKQAIAIALSKARRAGAKVPPKES